MRVRSILRWSRLPFVSIIIAFLLSAGLATAAGSPVVSAGNISATEGAQFSGQVATFTDQAGKGSCLPVQNNYKAVVQWGDGSHSTGTVKLLSSTPDKNNLCDYEVDAGHTYLEEGHLKLQVSVTGPGSPTAGTDAAAAAVADATLHASSGPQHATAGSGFGGGLATFTDADPGGNLSDYTASINWGDGRSGAGTISGPGPFAVNGSHTWAKPGTYTVTVHISDAGGAAASTHFAVHVAQRALNASVKLSSTGRLFAGQAVRFDASGSTAPVGSHIIAYRWDFNHDGIYDADTGSIPLAIHYFGHPGTHRVGLQVVDSSGRHSSETSISLHTVTSPSGCSPEVTVGWLDFVAGCITDNSGVYSIDLNDPAHHSVGATLLGVTLSSSVPGAQLQLDTTGSDEPPGTNSQHQWVLRSTAPVEVSIQNSEIGTIDLFQIPLNTNPIFLPVGADAPDQNADGLRIFTAEAQTDCPDHTGFPPVACATLPGGFPLEGSISLYAQAPVNSDESPGGAIETNVELHNPIHVTGDIALHGNAEDGIQIDHFGFEVQNIDVAVGTINRFELNYDRQDPTTHDMNVYEGSGQMSLRLPGDPQVSVDVRFANGGFQRAGFELSHASIPLGPVILNQLGGHLGVNPFSIGADLAGTVGPFSVGAGVDFTAATPTTPWHFELHDVSITYLNLVNATGSLAMDGDGFIGGDVHLTAGLPSYNDPHRFVSLTGFIRGFAYDGLFQIGGGVSVDAVLVPQTCPFCIHLHGDVAGFVNNSPGFAAGCGDVEMDPPGFHVGAWVSLRLSDGHVFWGTGDCHNLLPFCTPQTALGSHSGETGTRCPAEGAALRLDRRPQRFALPHGRKAETILVTSLRGVPSVKVTGPSGTFITPAKPKLPYIGAAVPDQHQLEISIYHGKPGIYTITPKAGSPPIEQVLESHSLAPPAIHVHVTGRGHTRTLVYTFAKQRGLLQRVVFSERGKQVAHVIGHTTRARGRIRFTPQAGPGGTRKIVAQLYNEGLPQTPRAVGSYRAPGPAKAGRTTMVSIVRGRNAVTITWARASNSAGYEVRVSAGDGRRVLYVVKPSKNRLVVRSLFKQFAVTAAVSAVGGMFHEPGRPVSATLRAGHARVTFRRHG